MNLTPMVIEFIVCLPNKTWILRQEFFTTYYPDANTLPVEHLAQFMDKLEQEGIDNEGVMVRHIQEGRFVENEVCIGGEECNCYNTPLLDMDCSRCKKLSECFDEAMV